MSDFKAPNEGLTRELWIHVLRSEVDRLRCLIETLEGQRSESSNTLADIYRTVAAWLEARADGLELVE